MKKLFGIGVMSLLLGTNGFGQAPALTTPEAEAISTPDYMSMGVDELQSRAAAMLQKGDTNAAIDVLMFCTEKILQQNAVEFNSLLDKLITLGKLPEADFVYRNAVAQYEHLPNEYYNRLYRYYVSQSNAPAMLAWTASLQTQSLPQDLRVKAFAWWFEAGRSVGPLSCVTDLVPVCIAKFDAPTACGLLNGVIGAYDGAGDQASANKVLDAIERAAGRQADLNWLVTGQRVNLLFSAARWPEAENQFKKAAKTLPDAELSGCFQYAQACILRANQLDLLDRLCAWILKGQKKKNVTWQAAANAWMESAKIRKAAADVPVRLEALMQMGCPSATLVLYYYEYWNVVAREGNPADIIALAKFAERLSVKLTDKKDKDIFQVYAFNDCIVLEDFERALKMLDKPLPNMNATAQQVAINKIKAHLALKKGNKPEAVERFRAFMQTVKTWSEPEFDPISGLLFTKEICLGMNAKRIGDILSSMNDAKGARAAYLEADGYYAVAQKEFKTKSSEAEYIKARRTELANLMQQ